MGGLPRKGHQVFPGRRLLPDDAFFQTAPSSRRRLLPDGAFFQTAPSPGRRLLPDGAFSRTTPSPGRRLLPDGAFSRTAASPGRRLLPDGGFSRTAASPGRRLLPDGGFSPRGRRVFPRGSARLLFRITPRCTHSPAAHLPTHRRCILLSSPWQRRGNQPPKEIEP